MRSLIVAALLLVSTGSCVSAMPPPPPAPPPDAPLFYDDLAPYGDWWWHERWGWVYSPYVDVGWRPYTVGHWVWTDEYGWLWSSGEPFGWACHHYGRWLWLDDAGWIWVPGGVWAPAWVVWRHGPGVIGWAPIGPDVVWVPGHGFVVVDVEVGITPWGWVFVDEPDFVVMNVVTVVHSHARNTVLLPSTRVVHRPERGDGDRVVNRGIDRGIVERATGKRIAAQRVLEVPSTAGGAVAAPAPDEVPVRRAVEVEERVRATKPRSDLSIGDLREPRAPEVRPLGTRESDGDVERRFDDEKRKAVERHQRERTPPAPAPAPNDELERRRQQQELDELERAKEKEKALRDKRKTTPRKIYPKKKPRTPAPPSAPSDPERK